MHVIQALALPRAGFPKYLYFRSKGEVTILRDQDGTTPTGLQLADEAEVRTNTYFGSLYLSYWRQHASVTSFSLMVRFAGRAKIRVVDIMAWGEETVLHKELQSSTPKTFSLALPSEPETLPFGSLGPFQRYVVVVAIGGCTLSELSFATETPPKRQVSLSIGLCTFNQEVLLGRTLERLLGLVDENSAIRSIYLVNHGGAFKSEKLRSLSAHPKVRAIEQRNLGGSGGFARTLYDAMNSAAPATHHLLMDDDIVLDERMIARAIHFLEYADKDLALGAPMLDSFRPTFMYEAGAFIRHDNRLQPYCHNVDLTPPTALSNFNIAVGTDYNAWWFCILPLERCRKIRLPVPIFIRGDDFEYGQRLAADGVPTISLPGIGVWHEPFYAKPPGWQDYYDLRNRLIFAANYPEKVAQLSLAHVTGSITTSILKHDYQAAELRLKAVADFLAGPDATLGRDAEELHREVMATARENAPERLEGSNWRARPAILPEPKRMETMRGLIGSQLLSLIVTGLGPLRPNDDAIFVDTAANPTTTRGRGYIATNAPRSYHIRYRPNRRRLWSLILRTAKLAARYRSGREGAGELWRARIADYRSPSFWQKTFEQSEDVALQTAAQ